MNWHDVALALHIFMVNHNLLNDYVVQFGARVPIPDAKTVVLVRGPSSPKTNEPKSANQLTLFVECWETGSDDPTEAPEIAYGLLSEMESNVFQVINEFGKGDQRIEGKQIKVRLGETEPDGDVFRPKVGSRTRTTISWL